LTEKGDSMRNLYKLTLQFMGVFIKFLVRPVNCDIPPTNKYRKR
jgi:hypothetical protein